MAVVEHRQRVVGVEDLALGAFGLNGLGIHARVVDSGDGVGEKPVSDFAESDHVPRVIQGKPIAVWIDMRLRRALQEPGSVHNGDLAGLQVHCGYESSIGFAVAGYAEDLLCGARHVFKCHFHDQVAPLRVVEGYVGDAFSRYLAYGRHREPQLLELQSGQNLSNKHVHLRSVASHLEQAPEGFLQTKPATGEVLVHHLVSDFIVRDAELDNDFPAPDGSGYGRQD